MTMAVGAALTVPVLSPAARADDAPDTSTTPSPSPATAAIPSGAPALADSTLGSLVAQQVVASGAGPSAAPLDLKGQDLRQTDLKSLNLKGADLSGANLAGVELTGLDLTGAKLDGANLSGANLTNTNLTGATAKGADFSLADLQNTTLDEVDASGAKFDQAFIGRAGEGRDRYGSLTYDIASNVKLDGASFAGATVQRVLLKDSSASGANFSGVEANAFGFIGSDVSGANFDHATGGYISFSGSDLSGAAITNSGIGRLSIFDTTIAGTKFAGTSFNGATFSETNLGVADLTGVVRQGQGAVFNHANLDGLDLSGFDFSHAVFVGDAGATLAPPRAVEGAGPSVAGTDFTNANFSGVIFTGYDLSAAKSFTGATLQNTQVQSGNAGALTHAAGVVVGPSRGQGIWVGDDPPPVAGVPWARTVDDARLMAQGLLPLQYAAGQARAPASDKDPAAAGGTIAPASVGYQAAALALKTLTAINDQLRAARVEAAKNKDEADKEAGAAPTDAAFVALSSASISR